MLGIGPDRPLNRGDAPRDDRVLRSTRILSAVIVPFLLLAFAVLYPWPSDTDRLFAWAIHPTFTAMLLGAVYLGGAYFFVIAMRATEWHTIKAGFPPVATFATLMGVATLAHWDRFDHHHVAFWLWVALYFTTPFLVFAAWWANRRYDARPEPADPLVPLAISWAIAIVGGLAVLTSAFLFLFPASAIRIWPWALTPLTARVTGAVLALGISAVGAVAERRRSAIRVMLQVEIVMVVLIALGAARARLEFDTGRPLTWALGAGLGAVLIASLVAYGRWWARPHPAAVAPHLG